MLQIELCKAQAEAERIPNGEAFTLYAKHGCAKCKRENDALVASVGEAFRIPTITIKQA